MPTGSRLLEESMPHNYKQGGGSRKRNAGKIRKAGQTKVRRQLKKDMIEELYDVQD